MSMDRPTQKLVRHLFEYDLVTGHLVWRNPTTNRVKVGDRVGHLHSRGYRHIGIQGRIYKAHRLIWLYVTGDWPTTDIDHINNDRDDNRWANLREATRDRNCQNTGKRLGNMPKGVTQRGNSYMVRIRTKGKAHYIGSFSSPQEAAAAYDEAAIRLHDAYAKTNKALGLI